MTSDAAHTKSTVHHYLANGLMNSFLAKSPRQLDLCLKLLYDANVPFAVRVSENEKRKIVYEISVKADEETYDKLHETYRILIS